MEYWVYSCSIWLKNNTVHGINKTFVWECHVCHKGVVFPGTYKNIHGQTVKIDPNYLESNTEVMSF